MANISQMTEHRKIFISFFSVTTKDRIFKLSTWISGKDLLKINSDSYLAMTCISRLIGQRKNVPLLHSAQFLSITWDRVFKVDSKIRLFSK